MRCGRHPQRVQGVARLQRALDRLAASPTREEGAAPPMGSREQIRRAAAGSASTDTRQDGFSTRWRRRLELTRDRSARRSSSPTSLRRRRDSDEESARLRDLRSGEGERAPLGSGCFRAENAHAPALPRPDVRASSTMRLRATGALLGRTDRRHQRGSPALVHDDVRARGRDAERRLRFHSISPGSPKRSVGKNTWGAAPAHARGAESAVVTCGACALHGEAAVNGFSAPSELPPNAAHGSRSQLSEQRLRVGGWPHLHVRGAAVSTGSSTQVGGPHNPLSRAPTDIVSNSGERASLAPDRDQ